jgi:hypothetical protein
LLALPQAAEQIQRHVAGYSDTELELIVNFLRAGREAADQEISRMRREGLPTPSDDPPSLRSFTRILSTRLRPTTACSHRVAVSACPGSNWRSDPVECGG